MIILWYGCAQLLSQDLSADTSLLRDKAAVIVDKLKGTTV